MLTANAPETKDNDFTWKDFQNRNNNELVAVLGNFVNRTLVLTHKYYDGIAPTVESLPEADKEILAEISKYKEKIEQLLETFHIRDAQREAMNIARLGNKYLADAEPWKVIRTDPDRVKEIMHVALQITANLVIAFEPFLPYSAEKLSRMLRIDLASLDWDMLGATNLVPGGHQIGEANLLLKK